MLEATRPHLPSGVNFVDNDVHMLLRFDEGLRLHTGIIDVYVLEFESTSESYVFHVPCI